MRRSSASYHEKRPLFGAAFLYQTSCICTRLLVPLKSVIFATTPTGTKLVFMNRLRILGLLLLLILPLPVKSATFKDTITRQWGSVLGRSNNAYGFLIYDATCSQSNPALFIVGKDENSSLEIKRNGIAYYQNKDEYTDAFLACMSLDGELLWSTYLPALESGYYNAFATTVEDTPDSTILVVGNAYQLQGNLENTKELIPQCPGKLFTFEFDIDGKLLTSKVLSVLYNVGGAHLPLYIPRIVKSKSYAKSEPTIGIDRTFGGFALCKLIETPNDGDISTFYYSCPFTADFVQSQDNLVVPFYFIPSDKTRYRATYALSPYVFTYVNFDQYSNNSISLTSSIFSPSVGKKTEKSEYPIYLVSRGIDLLSYSSVFEQWEIITTEIDGNRDHNFVLQGNPIGTYVENSLVNSSPHKQIFPGTVQNIHTYKDKYIVQGIHCQYYNNGFFKDFFYSHDSQHTIPESEKGFYQSRNSRFTAVPYLLIYDSATLFNTQYPEPIVPDTKNIKDAYDFETPLWGSYLDADWLYEDIFHVTDSAQWKDIYQPYEPVLCSYGNKFFFIGNAKSIDFDLIDNPTMTEEVSHHQGVVLAFSTSFEGDCPPEKTAFQDVRFLCPGDSVELKPAPDYAGFKFRFDPIYMVDSSIVLNADSSRAWAKKEGSFAATLDGSAFRCPDVAVDTIKISLSPYPEPASALIPDSTIVACAATGVTLNAVTEPDSTFSYRWFDNDSTASKTVYFNGDSLFFATVTVSGYCTSFKDSTQIRFLPPFVNLGADTTICQLFAKKPLASDTLLVLSAEQDYFPLADWYFRWQINDRNAGNDARIVVRHADLVENVHGHLNAFIVVQVALSDTNLNTCIATDTLSVIWFGADTTTNRFLTIDTLLCAHLDLSIQLPEKSGDFYCNWLDMDSILLPGGRDTTRFTISGLRGTDGFGSGADARSPRHLQLSLQHRYCPDWQFFDSLTVFDILKPAISLPVHDTLLCRGIPIEIEVSEPFVYKDFYTFEWSDGKDSTSRQFVDSGLFTLVFALKDSINICGYEAAADSFHILAPDPALTDINLPSDTTFCTRLSVTLNAAVPFPSTRYSWQEGDINNLFFPAPDNSDSLDTPPSLKINKEGEYTVFLLDSAGCLNTHQVTVTEDDCKPVIEIPNVFTPNGDGVNDVLKFKQLEKCFHVDIIIVNRQGNTVLHKKVNDLDSFSWNGCLNNGSHKLPDGPYFYLISYKNAYGKKKVQSGSITILGSRD